MTRTELERRVSVARELALRAQDPLRLAVERLTRSSAYGAGSQYGWLASAAREKLIEGGNQSGKTWTGCADFLLEARGLHPGRCAEPMEAGEGEVVWVGWFATTTYKKFAEQAWKHFLALLLYPGEELRVQRGRNGTGCRNILSVSWLQREPQIPEYLKIRRVDGTAAEIWVKSYEQGREEFQAAAVNKLVLDEEADDGIYSEAQPRLLAKGGQLCALLTPIQGKSWLAALRQRSESGDPFVHHARLDVRDNPSLTPLALKGFLSGFQGPDDPWFRLRVQGIPLALEGLVYNDLDFTPEHVCDPFELPWDWTRWLAIDHGWNFCGALWQAYGPLGEVVAYRDYKGEQKTVDENAWALFQAFAADSVGASGQGLLDAARQWLAVPLEDRLEGKRGDLREALRRFTAPLYAGVWIDPAVRGASGLKTRSGRGVRLLDLWHAAGIACDPAPDNSVVAGIERAKGLLRERIKYAAGAWAPRFRVFRSCTAFLDERRKYHHREDRERGDEWQGEAARPVKRDDHVLDPWRYLISGGAGYRALKRPLPPAGTLGRRLVEKRRAVGRRR